MLKNNKLANFAFGFCKVSVFPQNSWNILLSFVNPCEHPVSTKRLHILKHNLLSLYYVLVYIRFFRFQCLWLALFPFLKVLIKSLFSKKKKKNGFCNLFRTVHTVLIRSILSNKKVFVPTHIFRDKINYQVTISASI